MPCFDYVSGMGSATAMQVCSPVADPGTGKRRWNVEALQPAMFRYETLMRVGDITPITPITLIQPLHGPILPIPGNRFVDGLHHAKRYVCDPYFAITNFPCGYYNLVLNNADDDVRVYVKWHADLCGTLLRKLSS
ncbi:MAG: hypothetical protein U0T75_03765 [Chitinophagales bacterium]